jgi:hypothetical protein
MPKLEGGKMWIIHKYLKKWKRFDISDFENGK